MTDYTISNRASAELAAASVRTSVLSGSAKVPSSQSSQSSNSAQETKAAEENVSTNRLDDRQKLAAQESPIDKLSKVLHEDPESLDKTISKLNDSLQNIQRNLKFSVDDGSGKIVINVTDKETDKVVRQIPSEEVLHLARNLQALSQQQSSQGIDEQSRPTAEGVFFKGSV